jgi:hypothetical protein
MTTPVKAVPLCDLSVGETARFHASQIYVLPIPEQGV